MAPDLHARNFECEIHSMANDFDCKNIVLLSHTRDSFRLFQTQFPRDPRTTVEILYILVLHI